MTHLVVVVVVVVVVSILQSVTMTFRFGAP